MPKEIPADKNTEQPKSWAENNVLNPLANVAADAYNATLYNTVGRAANAVTGKDIVARAEHSTSGKAGTGEMVTQAVVTGVGTALVYVAAGRTAGGMIRLAEGAIGAEAKLAEKVGAERAASAVKMALSDRTSQVVGAVAYDGLRDTNKGETHLGNMAGSLTAFSIYEKFNPALKGLAFAPKMLGHGSLGSLGAAASTFVSDGVSGHLPGGSELTEKMIAGGAMNMVLPGAQKIAHMSLGKLNDSLGRGNYVERDMKLSGLAGQSSTLDELAGKVATLRVKTGADTTNLQARAVNLESGAGAADRAHEFAHEWFLKSHRDEFAAAAQLLKQGDQAGAWQQYRQLRLNSETYAHQMEAKVAGEVGDKRLVETNPDKIAALKTPEGTTYEAHWRKEFEQFKTSDGQKVAEIDYLSVPEVAGVQSMRELASADPREMKRVMRTEYYPGLKKAFPDKSEYEKISTYYEYLTEKGGTWDAVALRSAEGNVVGGIQSQVIPVDGQVLKNAVWGEHIWLAPEARSFPNFRFLMNTAAERFRATGSQMAFMEFNDRAKMTLQEMIQDAKGGLSTADREVIWGRFANKGLNILHFQDGKIAPYAQPGMDGQDPVNYLTLALIALDGKNLSGSKLPIPDYLSLLRKAHGTLVDVDSDPTVQAYTTELMARMARGETEMTFARLADTTVGRIVSRHPLTPGER